MNGKFIIALIKSEVAIKNAKLIVDVKIIVKRARRWFDYEEMPRPKYMERPRVHIPVHQYGLSTGRIVIVNRGHKHG